MEKNELREAAASYLKDPSKRQSAAEMIIEYSQPGRIVTDFVGLLLNTRNLMPGDMLVKKVRKGINVHTLVPGSIPLKSEITVTERANYVLDGSIVAVTFNDWELISGEIGTIDSIRKEMALKLRDHYMNRVFNALSTVWSAVNTASNFTDVGTDVTKAALDAAMAQINNTTPGVKAIVGTRNALAPIVEFAGWSTYSSTDALVQMVGEEVARTGWVGQYRGAPLVVLPQSYDYPDTYNKMVFEDKILVIGENVGEFITFGDVNFSQYMKPEIVPPQWTLQEYIQWGMMIDNAQGIYVLEVA